MMLVFAAAGPVFSSVESMAVEVTSMSMTYPPSLSLNCPTTSFPPTHTSWLLNGETQDSTLQSQVVRDPVTTAYDNTLTVSDLTQSGRLNFTCVVNNSRGSATATRTLLGNCCVIYSPIPSLLWVYVCACLVTQLLLVQSLV